MKTKLIMMLLPLAGALNLNAQNVTFTKVWEKVYGGFDTEAMESRHQIFLDKDSNVIIVGTAVSEVTGNKISPNCGGIEPLNAEMWIIKLDQNGNKIFDQAYGSSRDDGVNDAILLNDGSMILIGRTNSPAECYKSQGHYGSYQEPDIWILKMDSSGTKIWDKRYGTFFDDYVYSMVSTPDSGFLIAGSNTGDINGNIPYLSNGFYDILLLKLTSSGAHAWYKLIGGNDDDFPSIIIRTSNNDYIISASTNTKMASGDISANNIGGTTSVKFDNWVVKIDQNGNILWEKRYGCPLDDYGGLAFENSKGEFIIAGNVDGNCVGGDVTDTIGRGQSDIWIYALDSANGNILYDKRIGGNKQESLQQIIQMNDGGYLCIGTSNSDAGFEKSEPCWDVSGASGDFWIIKTDSLFNIQWDKDIGGAWSERNPRILLLNDSTFIISGQSDSPISGDKTIAKFDTANGGGGDFWVMKFTTSSITGIDELAQPQFTIYPNPVKDVLYVSPKKRLTENSLLSIIDMQGRVVKAENMLNSNGSVIPINVSKLSQGIYLLRVNGVVKRFVKM